MMTPALLDRATHCFRAGYRDGRNGAAPRTDLTLGSFSAADYEDGYRAAANELYWEAKRAAEREANR